MLTFSFVLTLITLRFLCHCYTDELLNNFYTDENVLRTIDKLSINNNNNGLKDELKVTLRSTLMQMNVVSQSFIDRKIPYKQLNLIIYQVSQFILDKDSFDISYNNLKIFIASVMNHDHNCMNPYGFYIFNVIEGSQNALLQYIPKNQSNVGIIHWPLSLVIEKEIFIKTLVYLGVDVLSKYSAIYTTSDKSRGPMIHYNQGKWLQEFRYLLDKNNIGIVGASSVCENKRGSIQPHMFAFRSSVLKSALYASKPLNSTKAITKEFFKILKIGIEKIVKSLKMKLSSILYYKRYNQISFEGECPEIKKSTYDNRNVNMQPTNSHRYNPTYWCDILPQEVRMKLMILIMVVVMIMILMMVVMVMVNMLMMIMILMMMLVVAVTVTVNMMITIIIILMMIIMMIMMIIVILRFL